MCFLFYLNMTTEQQILKILKEENRPLKAIEIADKFSEYFNEIISKKEVNKIIYNKLKREVNRIGFPKYTYNLRIDKTEINLADDNPTKEKHSLRNDCDTQNIQQDIISKDDTPLNESINNEILKLIYKYKDLSFDLTKLQRKPDNIKETFKLTIDKISDDLVQILDDIIIIILDQNISLSDLENVCTRDLYLKIENHNDIYNWINQKDDQNVINVDSDQDRIKEFKILCKKVWEDGVVTRKEQGEIDEKIIKLSLSLKDANYIFEQIRGEYEELHLLDKNDLKNKSSNILFDDMIALDGKNFYIKKIDQPMSPLFWHKYENGFEIIYINSDHSQFNLINFEELKKILVAICRTKLSFSTKEGDVFESRFKNYLNLI